MAVPLAGVTCLPRTVQVAAPLRPPASFTVTRQPPLAGVTAMPLVCRVLALHGPLKRDTTFATSSNARARFRPPRASARPILARWLIAFGVTSTSLPCATAVAASLGAVGSTVALPAFVHRRPDFDPGS